MSGGGPPPGLGPAYDREARQLVTRQSLVFAPGFALLAGIFLIDLDSTDAHAAPTPGVVMACCLAGGTVVAVLLWSAVRVGRGLGRALVGLAAAALTCAVAVVPATAVVRREFFWGYPMIINLLMIVHPIDWAWRVVNGSYRTSAPPRRG